MSILVHVFFSYLRHLHITKPIRISVNYWKHKLWVIIKILIYICNITNKKDFKLTKLWNTSADYIIAGILKQTIKHIILDTQLVLMIIMHLPWVPKGQSVAPIGAPRGCIGILAGVVGLIFKVTILYGFYSMVTITRLLLKGYNQKISIKR